MPRDYGKTSPSFWTGSTGRELRGDPAAQVVAHYLFTSPHSNMVGLYYLPQVYVSHDTGLSPDEVERSFAKLGELGFIHYDPETEWVWVTEMARIQIAETLKAEDKRTKRVVKDVSAAPESLGRLFWQRYEGPFSLPRSPFEAPSKPLRSQEQEQEQEQEQKQEQKQKQKQKPLPSEAVIPRSESVPKADVLRVFSAWRSSGHEGEYQTPHPGLKPWRAIEDRIAKDGLTVDDLVEAVEGIHCDTWDQRQHNLTLWHAVKDETAVRRFQQMARARDGPVLSESTRQTLQAGESWLRRRNARRG